MTREMIEQQRQEIADQNDRMIGLFVALCSGAGIGALVSLVWLINF